MLTDVDYYAVLGIIKSATPDEVRGAYRRAARASHPDLHPNDATAAERFKRIRLAYEVLGDPVRRAAYDAASVPPAPCLSEQSRPTRPPTRRQPRADVSVSLAHELGETVRAIRVVARRSGFSRRISRLIRYLERL